MQTHSKMNELTTLPPHSVETPGMASISAAVACRATALPPRADCWGANALAPPRVKSKKADEVFMVEFVMELIIAAAALSPQRRRRARLLVSP